MTGSLTIRGSLTTQEAEALSARGHVVFILRRRRLVRVDGFKLYRLKVTA